jgi:hypothetical protein
MEQPKAIENDMLDILYEDAEIPEEGSEGTWEVTDIKSADWAIGMARKAVLSIVEAKEYADFLHLKIDAWVEKIEKKNNRTIEFMKGALEPWAKEKLAGLKDRSFSLPAGKCGFRKGSDAVNWNEDLFGPDDAEKLGIPVKTVKSVLKTEVKKYIKSTGNIPDGVILIEGVDKFYVKLDEREV